MQRVKRYHALVARPGGGGASYPVARRIIGNFDEVVCGVLKAFEYVDTPLVVAQRGEINIIDSQTILCGTLEASSTVSADSLSAQLANINVLGSQTITCNSLEAYSTISASSLACSALTALGLVTTSNVVTNSLTATTAIVDTLVANLSLTVTTPIYCSGVSQAHYWAPLLSYYSTIISPNVVLAYPSVTPINYTYSLNLSGTSYAPGVYAVIYNVYTSVIVGAGTGIAYLTVNGGTTILPGTVAWINQPSFGPTNATGCGIVNIPSSSTDLRILVRRTDGPTNILLSDISWIIIRIR